MAYNFNQLNVKEKIGVGTETPTEALEVKGNIKLNSGVAVSEFSSDGTLAVVNDRSVPTTQAVKTYVNTQIATANVALGNKADKNGLSTQDFQANNLKVQGNLEVTGTTTFRNIAQHEGDVELGNENSDRVKIHGILESSHLSGALQINSPVNITSSLTANGNVTLNNTFLGDVGHGANWAGFSHSSSVSLTSYALLHSKDSIYTLLNKKSGGGYIGFRVDNADKMIVNDSGNVGIGTTAPSDRLDVAGNLRILTNSNPIRFTPSWSGFPDSTTNQAEICNDTNSYKTLMIVGNRSAGLGRRVSIWDRLEVNGRMSVTEGVIQKGGDPITATADLGLYSQVPSYWLRFVTNGGNFGFFADGGAGTTPIMFLYNNGNLSVKGTLSQGSSIKLKENVADLPIERAVAALNELNPVCFSYKADTQKEMHLGFIAEDVPDLVASSDRQSLSAMDLIAVLTSVVKKQQQAIAELTDRVSDLATKQV